MQDPAPTSRPVLRSSRLQPCGHRIRLRSFGNGSLQCCDLGINLLLPALDSLRPYAPRVLYHNLISVCG